MKAPTKYQIWFEPTERGREAFGWVAKPIGGPSSSKEEAEFGCYELGLEEPAPDWREYSRYVVREIETDENPLP